jgi:hypothetical protein
MREDCPEIGPGKAESRKLKIEITAKEHNERKAGKALTRIAEIPESRWRGDLEAIEMEIDA